jgi:hypothetical protein
MPGLFLDTTIQVDRIIAEDVPDKRAAIEKLLVGFNYHAACSYSRLEFKRVVIQNLALTLHYILEEQSFFRAMQLATRIKRTRRVSTLVNIMAWVGHRVSGTQEVTPRSGIDERLTLQAESFIRNSIAYIWVRFDKSVHSVFDKTECARAREAPRVTKSGGIDASIPAKQCKQKECNNANFLRSHLPAIRRLRDELEKRETEGALLTSELIKAITVLREAEGKWDSLYDYQKCLDIGDLWIHLESLSGGIKSFATTNYKESEVLCPLLDLDVEGSSKRRRRAVESGVARW